MLPLATAASPSHFRLLNTFLPTARAEFSYVDLSILPQAGQSRCAAPGWDLQLRAKAVAMRDSLFRCREELMLWSDVDIVMLRPVIPRLLELMTADYDLLAQPFSDGLCSGFYIVRVNDKTKEMFTRMVDDDKAYEHPTGDQKAMNRQKAMVNWGALPIEEFWTPGFRGDDNWKILKNPNEVDLLPTARIAHANYCFGVDMKLTLMQKYLKQSQATNPTPAK